MDAEEPETADLLRRAGLRVTAHRFAVLEWLVAHPHATADQVGTGVRERLGSMSKQAVYDVLAVCIEVGLVRRIEPAGHPARFERRTADNHHHLVCRACGAIQDADCVVGDPPCLHPADGRGFDVDEAEVLFWGTCPDCRPATLHAPDRADTGRDHARDERRRAPQPTEV